MKFNAIVGNPPYQGTNHQQIYPNFYLTSQKLADNVSKLCVDAINLAHPADEEDNWSFFNYFVGG